MIKIFLGFGAIFGGLSVVLGAFAAHALENRLAPKALSIWETGTRYQMYHALALVLLGLLLTSFPESTTLFVAGWAFIVGICLFSGSLYALSLTGVKVLGAIAPIGGLAMIVGWVCLAITAFKYGQ